MKNVLLICGGRSSEHAVSMKSARNIVNHIDAERYNLLVMGLTINNEMRLLKNAELPDLCAESSGEPCYLRRIDGYTELVSESGAHSKIDVAFPMIHGQDGEDGALQGFLQLMQLPFVGPKIWGSAISIRKDKAREYIQRLGIKSIPFVIVDEGMRTYEEAANYFGTSQLILKANVMGSSIGVELVSDAIEYEACLVEIRRYSSCVMIEPYIRGVDVECAILDGRASRPVRIVRSPRYAIYSYEAKYLDNEAVEVEMPAKISFEQEAYIKLTSVEIAKRLDCTEISRIDYIIDEHDEIYFSEINAIPGFTDSSAYHRMWQISENLSLRDVISLLITRAESNII